MTLQESLEAIESRLKASTPGPFEARCRELDNHALSEVWTDLGWYSQLPGVFREPTTEMFVHCPTDLSKLTQSLRVAAEALEEVEQLERGHEGTEEVVAHRIPREALEQITRIMNGEKE